MSSNKTFQNLLTTSTAAAAIIALHGCTGQIPGSFRLTQQEQVFSSQLEVNTKIDLLWVVDNSSSMDVSQEKLRKGFAGFAAKYMQPTWDIRVAVITTDTYLARGEFQPYLNQVITGTVGWTSPYVSSRLSTFVNPDFNPTLVNLVTGAFDGGIRYRDLVPAWGPQFAQLIPGLHDGPISAFCFEGLPYFLNGPTQCQIRDNLASTGTAKCLNPDAAAGETSISQCVNTIQNDTVRSGKAVISTMPATALNGAALQAWTDQLTHDFIVNVTTGSAGHGSERGLGSLLQLIQDNESSATAFFRTDSLRGIIFITDEDDQTLRIETNPPANFHPYTHYSCDQNSLIALNGAQAVTGNNGFCCADPAKNCRFGAEGTNCASKTVDGFTYTVSVCAKPELLLPVADVKTEMDNFFLSLDGADTANPNYFVVSIVPLTGAAIESLQASRDQDDIAAGGFKTMAVDRGDRYLQFGELVGNGSMAMNIADADYSPILDAIGRAIIDKKSTFWLDRAPTAEEDMIIKILHADGSSTVIPGDKYVINGKAIVITDQNLVLSLAATDKISINYQPKTLY